MDPLIIVMLVAQLAALAAIIYAVLRRVPASAYPRRAWSSVAIAAFVVSLASFQISTAHRAERGGGLLEFGAAVLIGMALVCAALAFGTPRSS